MYTIHSTQNSVTMACTDFLKLVEEGATPRLAFLYIAENLQFLPTDWREFRDWYLSFEKEWAHG